jgi:hypothetical protein
MVVCLCFANIYVYLAGGWHARVFRGVLINFAQVMPKPNMENRFSNEKYLIEKQSWFGFLQRTFFKARLNRTRKRLYYCIVKPFQF